MGDIVTSTADILAILGGATTLLLGIFGAVRLCWGALNLLGGAQSRQQASPRSPTRTHIRSHSRAPREGRLS